MPESHVGRTLWLIIGAVVSSSVVLVFAVVHHWLGVDTSGHPINPSGDAPAIIKKSNTKPRVVKAPLDVLSTIAEDLQKTAAAERPQRRYLTLTHLHNNPQVTEVALESARRTLRELAGFFSPPGKVLVFRPVDAEKTIFAVDFQELGWEPDKTWPVVLKSYPYGLTYDTSADPRLLESEAQVRKLSGSEVPVPYVRGDWFAVALTRPPVAGAGGALKTGAWPLPTAVRELAQTYDRQELDVSAAAAELYLADPARLETLVREEPRFRTKLELEPFTRGGVIHRKTWESLRYGMSPFQAVSQQLNLGTPLLAP